MVYAVTIMPRLPSVRAALCGALSITAVALGLHCGSGDESLFAPQPDGGTCRAGLPAGCGEPCGAGDVCPAGLFCGADGRCSAECAPGETCANGALCSAQGRCDGAGFGGGGNDGGGASDAPGPDAVCADVNVTLTKVLPKVLFLLDQSSSMRHFKFPSGDSNGCNPDCRWTVLKDVLIGPDPATGGLLKQLEAEAELGVEMYSATDPVQGDGDDSFLPPPTDAVCPRFNGKAFDGLSFAVNNATAIDTILRPASVDDDTPTGPAVRAVVGLLPDGGVGDPKGFAAVPPTTPRVLVLVTDGEPALCGQNNPSDPARVAVVEAVQQTFAQGIRTFVIAIGDNSAQAQAHFKAVANAGQGKDPNTGDAGAVSPTTKQALVDALRQIVLDARTCKFTLNGTVQPGTEQQGVVTLNGAPVPFDAPGAPDEGWRLVSPTEIELVGTACQTVKSTPNAQLSARFPCGSVVPGIPR